jgi:hypothetical protein
MSKPQQPLLKTCTSCGLQKPLSAFLQMTKSGSTYGTICADCRKANADKKVTQKEPEEETAKTSGIKISKVQAEIIKKEHFDKIDEEYHKDREKTEKKTTEKLEKREKTAKDESKHRSFLKTSSFLNTSTRVEDKRGQAQEAATAAASQTAQIVDEKQKIETGAKEELQQKSIDLTTTFIPSQTGGQIKTQSAAFNTFLTRLGASAPIVNAAKKAQQKPSHTSSSESPVSEKESPTDYIKNTWKRR